MYKKILVLCMAAAVVFATMRVTNVRAVGSSASLVDAERILYIVDPRASEYLERYSIQLQAESRGSMSVDMTVDGTKKMSRIGIMELFIEEKNTSTGTWHDYKTILGQDDPTLYYDYNSFDYLRTIHFDGTPGRYYRVTMTVHAVLNGVGFDTGKLTSSTVLCK